MEKDDALLPFCFILFQKFLKRDDLIFLEIVYGREIFFLLILLQKMLGEDLLFHEIIEETELLFIISFLFEIWGGERNDCPLLFLL